MRWIANEIGEGLKRYGPPKRTVYQTNKPKLPFRVHGKDKATSLFVQLIRLELKRFTFPT